MLSTKTKLSIVAALAFAVVAGSMTTEVVSKDKTGAVVGGLIAGAVVGAAVSSSINHPKTIYVDEGPRRSWDESFSPKPGIRCYRAQNACYKAGGGYSGTWTHRVYGR